MKSKFGASMGNIIHPSYCSSALVLRNAIILVLVLTLANTNNNVDAQYASTSITGTATNNNNRIRQQLMENEIPQEGGESTTISFSRNSQVNSESSEIVDISGGSRFYQSTTAAATAAAPKDQSSTSTSQVQRLYDDKPEGDSDIIISLPKFLMESNQNFFSEDFYYTFSSIAGVQDHERQQRQYHLQEEKEENDQLQKQHQPHHDFGEQKWKVHRITKESLILSEKHHREPLQYGGVLSVSATAMQHRAMRKLQEDDGAPNIVADEDGTTIEGSESEGLATTNQQSTSSFATSEKTSQTQQQQQQQQDDNIQDPDSDLVFILTNSLLSLTCVIFAALAAGLTMGLLSLDPLSLEIKRRASFISAERQRSAELLPLLVGHRKRHRLLVSLLILNSMANEALPLFLDELLPGKYASILVSVTLVLFFGEIVPSAFFTGPNQVQVAAKLVPVVKMVMFLLAPVAIPIARLLDWVLHEGEEEVGGTHGDLEEQDVTGGNYYDRSELTALVRIQHEAQLAKKRRTKLVNQKILTSSATSTTASTSNGAKRESRVTIATMHQHNPPTQLETISSHISHTSSSNNSTRNIRHTHHSIRAISRELTSSTSSARNSFSSARSNNNSFGQGRPNQHYSHYHSASSTSAYTPKRMPSIHADEITMIEGALAMTTKVAADVATPLRRVYALSSDTVLDEEQVVEIWARGFSRVPIFEPKEDSSTEQLTSDTKPSGRTSTLFDEVDVSSIVGVLLVRQLIVVNPNENRPLATIPLAVPPCVAPSMHLVDLINLFQAGGGRGRGGLHLALVCARPQVATEALERGESVPKEAGVIGIVTLEDVVEELLQEEIYDEYDRDLELARWGVDRWKRFVTKKKTKRLMQVSSLGNNVSSATGGSGKRVTISNADAVDIEAAYGAAATEATPLLDAVASLQDIAE